MAFTGNSGINARTKSTGWHLHALIYPIGCQLCERVCVVNINRDSHTQWERRRAEMTADPSRFDKREFDEIGDAIAVVKEAEGLSPLLMAAMLLSAMQRKFGVLIKAGHVVPESHQKIANRQNSIELSEAKKDIEWSESVVPKITVTNPEDGEWDIQKRPVWWATDGSFDSENDTKLWVESVFTNSFWNAINDVAHKGEARTRVMFITGQFTEQMDHIVEKELADERGPNFAQAFMIIRKVMKGIHAIVNPAPGAGGASLADVQYVFPSNYTAGRKDGLGNDLPRIGRSIIMALRRDGSPSKPVWQELVTEYMERLGMSESVKDEYNTIENSFHDMVFKFCAVGAEMDSFLF